MTGVTTNSYTQDARERTGRRKKAWWCVLPRPKGYRSRHASVRRWRSSLLCSPFAVSRGAETKGPSGGRPARRGPSVIETRRVELALLGLASRGVVVGMTVKPRKAAEPTQARSFPNLVGHQPGNGDFECCARHSQPTLRDRRRVVARATIRSPVADRRGHPPGPWRNARDES